MNVVTAIRQLLAYFPPEDRSVPDASTYPGRNAAALAALNGALQEYYGTGQAWKRRESRGALLRAPATVTVAVTNGSNAITITGLQDWHPGCTIAISGASTDNQLRTATALLYPHDGATGSTTAVILHDSIALDADVQSVLKPVRIVDGPPLHPVASPEQLTLGRERERDYGFHNHQPVVPSAIRKSQSAGTPLYYFVDNYHASANANPTFRMLISPAPAKGMLLAYRARLTAPVLTDAASTANIPVPFDAVDSIILPIAALRLSGQPFFRNGPYVEELKRQAALAHGQLFAMSAQASTGIRMRPAF
jgi:hypothetical protein